MTRYSVIWNIDGDMNVTKVDTNNDTKFMSSDDWLTLAVLFDSEDTAYNDTTDKINTIFEQLTVTTNSYHPNFIGYVLVGVIQHPEGMENLPWVVI